MPNKILKKFLDDHHIKYVSTLHSPAYTAQEIAEITHVKAREFAKSVIINLDGKMAMVVLPAHIKVNFKNLKEVTGAQSVELASEYEFQQRFPDCELGAMPPFGNLFDMQVFMDKVLMKDNRIAFNAGTHSEIIQLNFIDYQRLVNPTVISL